MKIKKAILPVAGFGTRFLPATKAQPKEMLPVYDTPAIQFIIEEAVQAGIENIIVVTGRGKRAIEDHFDDNLELEAALREKGKFEELEMIKKISNLANFAYVRQSEPLGDGHAILCAKNFIDPGESVVVLFGDDLVDNPSGKNAVEQLLDVYEATKSPVVLLEQVPLEETRKYGIVKLDGERIVGMVEKPLPENAPSNFAVVGKFIMTPEIMKELENVTPSQDGEIRLTAALQSFIKSGGNLRGKILEGIRFDTGDKLGFLKATLHFALKKAEAPVRKALQDFLLKQH